MLAAMGDDEGNHGVPEVARWMATVFHCILFVGQWINAESVSASCPIPFLSEVFCDYYDGDGSRRYRCRVVVKGARDSQRLCRS